MRAITLSIVSALVAACASGGGARAGATAGASAGRPPNGLAAVAFAPALAVDLGAMRPTTRGAYVRDVRVGDGMHVRRGDDVQVRYAGWLADATPIDAVGERDAPISFRVGAGQVVRGWEDGVLGMRVGGRRQLVIPPALGYGGSGQGKIPPNATLVFIIDVVGVR